MGGRKGSPTCCMELSNPDAEVVKGGCHSVLRVEARVRPPSGNERPSPQRAPPLARSGFLGFLRSRRGIPVLRPAAGEAGAESGVSARRRCRALQSGKENRNPGRCAERRLRGDPATLCLTVARRSGVGSPLFVAARASPAASHVLCASPPALASACLLLSLSQRSWRRGHGPLPNHRLPLPPSRLQQVTLSV